MAWYDDNTRKSYVATYKDEKSMRSEVEAAAHKGFVTQAMTRKGNEWTVSYQRDDRAWARIQVEQALQNLDAERGKLLQAASKVSTLEADLQSRFRAARTETSNPTQLEQRLLKAVTDLIAARKAANTQRQVLIASYPQLAAVRDEATRMQVQVQGADRDVDAETAPLKAEIDAEGRRILSDEDLQRKQQAVVKQVQEWQRIVGDRWGAQSKLARLQAKSGSLMKQPMNSTSLQPPPPTVSKAEAELTRLQVRLNVLETQLQHCESDLLRELEARDKRIVAVAG